MLSVVQIIILIPKVFSDPFRGFMKNHGYMCLIRKKRKKPRRLYTVRRDYITRVVVAFLKAAILKVYNGLKRYWTHALTKYKTHIYNIGLVALALLK